MIIFANLSHRDLFPSLEELGLLGTCRMLFSHVFTPYLTEVTGVDSTFICQFKKFSGGYTPDPRFKEEDTESKRIEDGIRRNGRKRMGRNER
jgi:hypothetical protein